MSKVFLFGGIESNFNEHSKILFQGADFEDANMVLLLQDESIREYMKEIIGVWGNYINVKAITPIDEKDWISETAECINDAAIIAIGPGKTMKYKECYIDTGLDRVIRRSVIDGAVYAGISAGAIITGERFARDNSDKVVQYSGLGILKDMCIEPHFEGPKKIESILYQMKETQIADGLGLYSSICLEISDYRNVNIHGDGFCYRLRKSDEVKFEMIQYSRNGSFEI